MRLLITGLSGTLAPHLASAAARAGHEVIGWNRHQVRPEDREGSQALLERLQPDAVAHLAMGPETWAGQLAAHARERGRPMLFTSTAMVFDHQPDGPHAVQDPRNARDDYGRYKMRCEDAVLAAHPQAMVVRLGWQIHADAHGNNMLAALDAQQARDGFIAASRLWRPACSFMEDSAAALLRLLASPEPGVHHLDSNAVQGHSFAAIVSALAERFDRGSWDIRIDDRYRHDQRLAGGERLAPPLSHGLPALTRRPPMA